MCLKHAGPWYRIASYSIDFMKDFSGSTDLMQVYKDLFVDQDAERTEHIFDRLADSSGSIDIVGWSQGIRLQVCLLQGTLIVRCLCSTFLQAGTYVGILLLLSITISGYKFAFSICH